MKIDRREMFGGLLAVAGTKLSERLSGLRPSSATDSRRQDPRNRYWLGAAYYPEQWPKDQWEGDFAKMKALGVNTVRMTEFAWSSIESVPGRF